MSVLVINNHDYSSFIVKSGYGWSRSEIESDQNRRTKNGRMRRVKIADKRKLSYELRNLTREQLSQLDDDLSPTTFYATYKDLHGTYTKEFYCNTFSCTMDMEFSDNVEQWSGASFTLEEV